MKKPKPVASPKLPSMSATLLAFAKPLLDQVEDPPTAKTLQGILNIAMVVWNLPLYEQAKHANAATFRAGLESALASIPAQGQAEVRATAFLLDVPPGSRGSA
jgi:hypothetical protein